MELTQETLAALEVPEAAAETILAALGEETARGRQLAEQLAELTGERDSLAGRVEQLTRAAQARADEEEQAARDRALEEALRQRGANEQALKLLMTAGGAQEDPQAAAQRLQEAYPAMFVRAVRIPVPEVAPPVRRLPQGMTARDIRAMTTDEINRNWSAVRSALKKGETN